MKRLKRKPMSRTFTAIAGLAALIALSASLIVLQRAHGAIR